MNFPNPQKPLSPESTISFLVNFHSGDYIGSLFLPSMKVNRKKPLIFQLNSGARNFLASAPIWEPSRKVIPAAAMYFQLIFAAGPYFPLIPAPHEPT